MFKGRGDCGEMQTEVPTLPFVCADSDSLNQTRKLNASIANNSHSQCALISKRKQLSSILGAPYKDNMRVHRVAEFVRPTHKNSCGERILSAKMLRVKELQNQLTDAHYHLNELASENRLLKALQKRQDSALKRYEGPNAELPKIIHSHHEELKVLQVKYKQLKAQHKHACDVLKEKESEVHSLRSQNKHLLRLSKDQHLKEREKLQMQVSDLNHQIEQQHETIQILNRKLSVESKKLRHQLNAEVNKHKSTRKQLQETLDKLKTLEELLNNREKRLYYNGRLPTFKIIPSASQSLTNLRNSATARVTKTSNKTEETCNELRDKSLPKLLPVKSDSSRVIPRTTDDPSKSETMASLQQVRKFRLQRSALSTRDMFGSRDRENNVESEAQSGQTNDSVESEDEEIKHVMNRRINSKYLIPKDVATTLESSSNEGDSSGDDEDEDNAVSPTRKSKQLHARLINTSVDTNQGAELSKDSAGDPLKDHRSNVRTFTSPMKEHNDTVSQRSRRRISIPSEKSSFTVPEPRNDGAQMSTMLLTDADQPRVTDRVHRKISQSTDDVRENFYTEHRDPIAELWNEKPAVHDDLLDYFDKNRETTDLSSRFATALEINPPQPILDDVVATDASSVQSEERNPGEVDSTDVANEPKNSPKDHSTDHESQGREKVSDNQTTNYNKQKLLAAMKAIDDNENISFISPNKNGNAKSISARSKVTENLYRGLPTHTQKRDDIIKEIFGDTKVTTKLRSGCSKLH